MVAGFVDRILAISVVMPNLIGKKLELATTGPVVEAFFGYVTFPMDFL